MPRWAQSIRFRLSLAHALAVFAAGAVLIAGLYLWQVRQLNDPILMSGRRLVVEDPATGELFDTELRVLTQSDIDQAFLEQFEREAYREALNQLRRASLAALGVLFVVAFGSGWLLSGWTLRPMGRMAAVARDISGTELSRRIGLQGPDDELKDLADTFDEMLDRLQASFEGQRRFIQDASHELRNPLAVTQTNLELVIDDPGAGTDELRDAARIAHTSTGRIGQIIDDLVSQARRDVPSAPLSMVGLDLLASEVAAELRASAAARELKIVVAGGGAVVHGDAAALRRAVTNLVVNAVRLAPRGTTIEITVGIEGDCALIGVADRGPGIAPEDHEAVFERFWRGTGSGKGLGLGLSIVRQVAERHGGRVELVSAAGQGSTFTIALPMPVARSAGV
jgi:signal transduction histidine kinase